jgi:hypothetical protein
MGKSKSYIAYQFITNAIMKGTGPLCLLFFVLFMTACGESSNEPTPSTDTGQKTMPVIKNGSSADITPPNRYSSVDISPMDMSYFPVDYPKIKMANSNTAAPLLRVIYSRPHLGKRRLFHDILKYNETWRLGANEATEIDFYKPVTIQGKKINPGRYILYAIPHPDKWTVVLNSNIDSWGLQQDPAKDIQRFEIPVSTDQPMLEYFTMVFEKTDTGANLIIGWDTIIAKLPIDF